MGAPPVLWTISGVSGTTYPRLRIAKPAVASSSSRKLYAQRTLGCFCCFFFTQGLIP
jgi:hypothetical protein